MHRKCDDLGSPVNHTRLSGAIGPVPASCLFNHQHEYSLLLLLAKNLLSSDATAFAHAFEDASSAVEVDGCVEFGNLTLVHDTNAVVVDDSLQAMRDTKQRFTGKPIANTSLDKGVGLGGISVVFTCRELDHTSKSTELVASSQTMI
jgi:hypothetical protein